MQVKSQENANKPAVSIMTLKKQPNCAYAFQSFAPEQY
jgi:hypothetical protein